MQEGAEPSPPGHSGLMVASCVIYITSSPMRLTQFGLLSSRCRSAGGRRIAVIGITRARCVFRAIEAVAGEARCAGILRGADPVSPDPTSKADRRGLRPGEDRRQPLQDTSEGPLQDTSEGQTETEAAAFLVGAAYMSDSQAAAGRPVRAGDASDPRVAKPMRSRSRGTSQSLPRLNQVTGSRRSPTFFSNLLGIIGDPSSLRARVHRVTRRTPAHNRCR